MLRPTFHGLIWTWALAGALVVAGAAHAQVSADQKAAAEALFDKGLELMKRGDYQDACGYLEQSQAIERGIGTMLYLAECYEKLGRTASAWALFREAASAAQAEGQPERAAAGAARAQQLEPQLSKLIVAVPTGSQRPGLAITRNGGSVPSPVWGLAIPVDPGPQRLEARAPGYEPWSHSENVGKSAQATVTIPPLAAAALGSSEATPPVPAPAETASRAPTLQPSAARDETVPIQHTAGIVTGGAGLVALVVGTYFGVRAAGKSSDADELCPKEGPCDSPEGVELSNRAQDAATLANVFVIGGAVLGTAGLVLYFTAPDDSGPVLAVRTNAGGAGLSLGGRL